MRKEVADNVLASGSDAAVRALAFDLWPAPCCLVDAGGGLVALNASAEAFWGVRGADLAGRPAMAALGIRPVSEIGDGDAWAHLAQHGPRPAVPCRVSPAGGGAEVVSVTYVALVGSQPPLAVLIVAAAPGGAGMGEQPDWALHDAVTGLGNRHLWERELPVWSRRSATVVFFDMDDLKEINDLHGHLAGDRTLAAVGAALARIAPPGALAVRYGGDEFVVLLPWEDEDAAQRWAEAAVGDVAARARSVELPIVPRLSLGVAGFVPGGLREAVQRADDRLYERRGTLLPAAGGSRIILTREGRSALRAAGDERRPAAPVPNTRFSPEFDGYFRAVYTRSFEQAREFVEFARPPVGGAVIEVGAGSGRITFDGRLAERVGPGGQLLVTDPSAEQLIAARQRAGELGLGWLRFLRAAAENLPVASSTVDMVLGSTFLHFTEPVRALEEMARLVRGSGRVVVAAPLGLPWSASMRHALAPVEEALGRRGLPLPHFLLTRAEIEAAVAQAGLRIERLVEGESEDVDFPSAEVAVAAWRLVGLVPLLLRGTPPEDCAGLQAQFEDRLRQAFDGAEELRHRRVRWLSLSAARMG